MARRNTSRAAAPVVTLSSDRACRNKTSFGEWLDRERVAPKALANELGITVGYVLNLGAGRATPGWKLRLKIQALTDGAVSFESWE